MCVPRASGDKPRPESAPSIEGLCSPRQRGYTERYHRTGENAAVFPAPAGINRPITLYRALITGVPRASGDKPTGSTSPVRTQPCSPRQRG
ncbi:hypothetical protein, partial [Salmonella enterica]|uniref:hypothetical protein n=1 Tax=Salmonella enterica TaxID=28901 RepID=UPI00309B81D5